MNMQCQFKVEDVLDHRVIKHFNNVYSEGIYSDSGPDSGELLYVDYYIFVASEESHIPGDPVALCFSCDKDYKEAWFSIDTFSSLTSHILEWMIKNRIPFTCS